MKNKPPPIPTYFRLQTAIRDAIEKGLWKPGDAIPPERALAQQYRVSIGTAKKALLNLAYEGYLYRIQGKGTFVAGTTISRENLRYYRLLERFGDSELPFSVRFLTLKVVKAGGSARACLKIAAGQKLFELKRLIFSGERRIIYTLSYLPEALFSGLERISQALFETRPLYVLLEEKYRMPTLYNHELFSATPAEAPLTDILKVPRGTPLLYLEMLSYTYKDMPYEYRQAHCLTDHHKLFREI